MKHRRTTARLLAAALLAGSVSAHAGDAGLSARVMTGLGQAIAAQGNIAFHEMREELARNLAQTLKPLLPAQPAERKAEPQPAAASDLPAFMRLHEQARSAQ